MTQNVNLIDGGYWDKERLRFGAPKTDMARLTDMMSGGRQTIRNYYYHCVPSQFNSADAVARERAMRKRQYLFALQRGVLNWTNRLGYLSRLPNGKEVQKGVDVMLSLDLVELALTGRITHAAILAGDRDFLPAIKRAKTYGVSIHLFHGPVVKRELLRCCDQCTLLTPGFFESVRLLDSTANRTCRSRVPDGMNGVLHAPCIASRSGQ